MLPYIKGTSEALRRIFGSYGIRACFKPTRTLRNLLVSPKDKTEKKDTVGPVYLIPCQGKTTRGQCTDSYIGETERSLKTRILEHRRPSSTSSEVSQHIHIESPGRHMDLERSKYWIWILIGLREVLSRPSTSESTSHHVNKDGGCYRLLRVYDPILTSLKVNNTKPRQKSASAEESCSYSG